MTELNSLKLQVKDIITYVGIIVLLAGNYFAIRHDIQSGQIRQESNIREIMLTRDNDTRLADLKEQQLRLQVERIELEIRDLKKQIQ